METGTQERIARTFEQAAIANGDAAAATLGVTQRVIGPLTELALATAKENARLAAELQVAALEALHDSQAEVARRMAAWPEMVMDPLRLCHRALADTLDTSRRALTFMGTNARLVAQAAERIQTAALDTRQRVRESLDESAAAVREAARR